jgi:hypothetical protein
VTDKNTLKLIHPSCFNRAVRFILASIALTYLPCTSAIADVEKLAIPCEQKICFHWWPRLPAIEGWEQDRGNSIHYSFNALAPTGKSFGNAETVMYAKAIFRPRVPDDKTLEQFISGDKKKFISSTKDIKIQEAQSLKTANGKSTKSFLFSPVSSGQWERVSYFEEGEYYMVFVISSRTETALQAAMSAYESLVTKYSE